MEFPSAFSDPGIIIVPPNPMQRITSFNKLYSEIIDNMYDEREWFKNKQEGVPFQHDLNKPTIEAVHPRQFRNIPSNSRLLRTKRRYTTSKPTYGICFLLKCPYRLQLLRQDFMKWFLHCLGLKCFGIEDAARGDKSTKFIYMLSPLGANIEKQNIGSGSDSGSDNQLLFRNSPQFPESNGILVFPQDFISKPFHLPAFMNSLISKKGGNDECGYNNCPSKKKKGNNLHAE